ncbi:MAG: 2'-5' RNA ligase family protein [Pseudonocardia sp.]|nr:2'-5' RNA ligase family protein [Pseudonocardia sp.]
MADEQDDTEQRTGGMIALVPRSADATSMVLDDGEPVEELHLTLAYLGDDVTDWPGEQTAELLDAVRVMAEDFEPVTMRVLAHTVFNADGEDEKKPCAVYLMSDSTQLAPLRAEALALTTVEQFEPHIPHVTAGYGRDAAALNHTGTVIFDRLRVALAGQVTDFELAQGELLDDLDEKAAEPGTETAPAPASGRKRKRVASEAGEERYNLPIGTELGQARGTEGARKAQADPKAKARYDDFMTIGDAAGMRDRARSLSDDDLKSLSEVMYSFKTSNPRVVAARNALAADLRRRGFDERDFGSMAGGRKRGSGQAPSRTNTAGEPKKKGSLSEVEERAWRRRATDSGGRIRVDSLTEEARKKLLAAGWAGGSGDGAEALYPPGGTKSAEGYLGEHYEGKARFVRTSGGVDHFNRPIGAPIITAGLSVRAALSFASLKQAAHDGTFKTSIRAMDDDVLDEVTQMFDIDDDISPTRAMLLQRERRRRDSGGIPTPRWEPPQMEGSVEDYDDFEPKSARPEAVDDDSLEVKRTTSKPWETAKLKKAGHTVSKEKGDDGDKYPIKTIGDLAAAVKRAKSIKDPEQKAKVWKHLRAEAKRLKAPNMVPADAPGGGKGSGFVPFKKGESKRAIDYVLSADDRSVLAALETKYASPDPRARRLRTYWAKGAGRAKWDTFRELRRQLASKGVPAQMLNGLTANIYHAAKGEWPGRKRGEKTAETAVEVATEAKVMISPDLMRQMPGVTDLLDDDEALAEHEVMADLLSTEQDYERALVAEVEWELGLDGELDRVADLGRSGEAPREPGFFDDDFEPLEPERVDLLSFAG